MRDKVGNVLKVVAEEAMRPELRGDRHRAASSKLPPDAAGHRKTGIAGDSKQIDPVGPLALCGDRVLWVDLLRGLQALESEQIFV